MKKILKKQMVLMCIVSVMMLVVPVAQAESVDPTDMDIQEAFDYIGPVVHQFALSSGKSVAYVDEGDKSWTPVLFVGGAGTAARVTGLTDFARSLRRQLKLRVISIGRNGFGRTEYVPNWGYAEYAGEVGEVLAHLGIERFVGMAISGGGPYLAAVAASMPDRVMSLHLAAATTRSDPGSWNCQGSFEDTATAMRGYATRPAVWWNLGDDTSIAKIPGFQETANEDGARSFYMRGQLYDEDADPENRVERAVTEEYRRFCTEFPDVSNVQAPAYVYYGLQDTSVSPEHATVWQSKLNVVKMRPYPGEGHDIQYRHWEQILLDMAGFSEYLLVCDDGASRIVAELDGQALVESGTATLGICAWQTGARN